MVKIAIAGGSGCMCYGISFSVFHLDDFEANPKFTALSRVVIDALLAKQDHEVLVFSRKVRSSIGCHPRILSSTDFRQGPFY